MISFSQLANSLLGIMKKENSALNHLFLEQFKHGVLPGLLADVEWWIILLRSGAICCMVRPLCIDTTVTVG